jgi:PKD repeat protein
MTRIRHAPRLALLLGLPLALGACGGEAPTGALPAAAPGRPDAAVVASAPTASLVVTGGIGTGGTAFTGGPVYFDGSGSTPGVGSIESYGWDRNGDGTVDLSGTTPTLTRRYNTVGTYTVGLTVTDGGGGTSTATRQVTVAQNHAPSAVIANGGTINTSEGATIAFSSAGSGDADAGQDVMYRWNFGDGTGSIQPNPSKRYGDNGTYTVTLTLTDASGAVSTATSTVQATNVAPTGALRVPAALWEETQFGLAASRIYDASVADRNILEFSFDCGDGAGYGSFDALSTAACDGGPDGQSRTLGVRIRDKDGGQNEYTRTVTIANAAPQVTLGALTPTTTTVGATIWVQGSFSDAGTADNPWAYTYYWGNGQRTTGSVSAQGTLPSASYIYTTPGTYSVRVRVIDKNGTSGWSGAVVFTVQ